MSRTADVVVDGGGVIGASAAYHLAVAGLGRVLLLERADALGTGSTGACAGGFRFLFSSEVNVRLSLASIPMIVGFGEQHGIALDVWRDGYLFLVRDEEAWPGFIRGFARGDARLYLVDVGVEARPHLLPGVALVDEGLVGEVAEAAVELLLFSWFESVYEGFRRRARPRRSRRNARSLQSLPRRESSARPESGTPARRRRRARTLPARRG